MLFKNKKKKETFDTNKATIDLLDMHLCLIKDLYKQNNEIKRIVEDQKKAIKELQNNLEALNKLVSK